MKKLIGGAAIVVALAAGYTGAAYWSGVQAERWYQETLAGGAANPNLKLTTVRYERGLFSSQAVTRVQFIMPEGSDLQEADPSFSIRQDIYHGPLPLAGHSVPGVPMQWSGSVVRATLDSESSAWTRQLAKLYGGLEPIEAISRISFDGASDTRIAMPPLTLNDIEEVQSLKFAGLQGQFQVEPHLMAVQGQMTVPSLELIGKPAAAAQPSGNIMQIRFNDLNLRVNQRKGTFNLMFGDSSFRIGEMRVQDQNIGAPFVTTGLTMTATARLQDPRQVAAEVVIAADQITANQRSGSGSLRMGFRNLDGATVAQLQQWQQKLASQPTDPQIFDVCGTRPAKYT
jgi:uncharacterized protein YdgA (DUF945 family)